jgi:hypothetical protein
MPITPLRWFAFRLRTLLVVVSVLALPLAWVGYSLEWIRQRQGFFVKYSPGVGPQFTRAICVSTTRQS